MARRMWKDYIEDIQLQLSNGVSLEAIGFEYGVSRQRMYQVLTKFGLSTNVRVKKSYLRDKPPKFYWVNKMLAMRKVPSKVRLEMLENMEIPDVCPILGIELNYLGTGSVGFSRTDASPSLDQIVPSAGYTKDNIQIISWRANRIKNDGTPEELLKIAEYMLSLTKDLNT